MLAAYTQMMNAYLSKSERAVYEQRRRKAVIQESRDYRLMSKWLLRVYPDVITEFHTYKTRLQRANPYQERLDDSPTVSTVYAGGRRT